MSTSNHIIGFIPQDAGFKKMKKIYDLCKEGNIEVPEEVQKFFNYETPDDSGVWIDLEGKDFVKDFYDDMESGWEIDVTRIPKIIKTIRFYISY